MQTFRDVIGLWPTVPAFAIDVGVGERTAFSWWQRDSIPADWFAEVVRAAGRRGHIAVTAEAMAIAAEKRRLAKVGHDNSQCAA